LFSGCKIRSLVSAIASIEITPNLQNLGCNFLHSGEHLKKGCQFWQPFLFFKFSIIAQCRIRAIMYSNLLIAMFLRTTGNKPSIYLPHIFEHQQSQIQLQENFRLVVPDRNVHLPGKVGCQIQQRW